MEVLSATANPTVYPPAIDAEHLQIERTLGQLCTAVADPARLRESEPLLRQLVREIGAHFAHEERLMQASRYAEFAWHKRQHGAARRLVKELVSQFAQGDPGAISPLLESIGAWLTTHIGVADSMASSHLRNYEREIGARGRAGATRNVKRPQ